MTDEYATQVIDRISGGLNAYADAYGHLLGVILATVDTCLMPAPELLYLRDRALAAQRQLDKHLEGMR